MIFDSRNLDQKALYKRALDEAEKIHKKPSTSKNRSLKEIINTCLYGQAAEQYLIEVHGWSDDPRPYKDVINLDNEPVEVKVTEGKYYVPYVLKRADQAATETYRNYPKRLIIFINNKKDFTYEKYGEYVYNGHKFTKEI